MRYISERVKRETVPINGISREVILHRNRSEYGRAGVDKNYIRGQSFGKQRSNAIVYSRSNPKVIRSVS